MSSARRLCLLLSDSGSPLCCALICLDSRALFVYVLFLFVMASLPFPNSIAGKLDDSNYLQWRQYVEPIIKSHKLQRLVNHFVPSCFLIESEHITFAYSIK